MNLLRVLNIQRASLSKKLLLPLTIVSILTLICVGAVQMYLESKRTVASLHDEINTLGGFLSTTSGPYVSNFDIATLENFVAKGMANRHITAVTFFGSDGKPLTKTFDSQAFDEQLKFNINDENGRTAGTLVIGISHAKAAEAATRAMTMSGLGYGIVLVLNIILVVFVTRSVAQPFTDLRRQLLGMADNTGRSGNELLSASEELGSVSNEQAAAVQEVVSSITQMRSMLETTQEVSGAAKDLGTRISQKTDDGNKSMTHMAQAMTDIQGSTQQLVRLTEVIEKISEKTGVINDIVFKTQLLSFNASIEAARAGQHGKGFSVVADEVGKLAQTSGQAAKEIQSLIKDSQRQVSSVIDYVTKKIKEGNGATEAALQQFDAIAQDIVKVSQSLEEVAAGSQEQFAGISQTSKAMEQMRISTRSYVKATGEIHNLALNARQSSELVRKIATDLEVLIAGSEAVQRREGQFETAPVTTYQPHPLAKPPPEIKAVSAEQFVDNEAELVEIAARLKTRIERNDTSSVSAGDSDKKNPRDRKRA